MDHFFYNSYASVYGERLLHNLEILNRRVKPDVLKLAVVKADAYGHGAVQVARHIARQVDVFAVAQVDEGIDLREGGISNPILVLGTPNPHNAEAFTRFGLTATVSDMQHFEVLPAGAAYHLNFDTGMGRYGFQPSRVSEVKEAISRHSELHCKGIYSHFSMAHLPENSFVYRQLELFDSIRAQFDESLTTHISNSGGALYYPGARFDMVRYGIGLYGYSPGPETVEGLQPVLEWKSRLAQVKRMEAGDNVSYGNSWQAPRSGWLGVVPVGYADGLPRALSNSFQVAIRGERYDSVGTVTMDNIMVWMDQDPMKTDTEVSVMGGDAMDAQEWADIHDTIPYEVLVRISSRVQRKFIK